MRTTISYWHASAPAIRARRALDEKTKCEVAVLGGGMAGVTTAYLLAREGVDVVLLEAETIGAGATGNTSAKVTSAHGMHYASLERRHGAEAAAAYALLNEQAIVLIDEIRDAEQIDCSWRRRDAYTYSTDLDSADELTKEAQAAARAGLAAEFVETTPLPFPVGGAVKIVDQAEFHPVRWLRGAAAGAERLGARIFEHSRALDVSGSSPCTVRTRRGKLEAERVIVATHYPTLDRGLFFARLSAQRSYCIGLRAAGPAPEGMFLSADSPTRSLRSHPLSDGGELLIVGGEGHKVGQDDDTTARHRALEDWARAHFDVVSIDYRWSAQDAMPPDQLPYVGPLTPRNDHVFVATGFAKWGMTNGAAAAAILCDTITGRENEPGRIMASNRFDPFAAGPTLVKENLNVARHLIGDRITRPTSRDDLAPGEGAIVRERFRRVAAFRDDDGTLYEFASACTHLGCEVRFNDAERSWDCPCHGSRFDALDGRVLEGPAVHGLAPIDPQTDDDDATNRLVSTKESR